MCQPELRLHRLRDLADVEGEGSILERLQHLAAGEEAEVAALGIGVFRLLLGNGGEVLALLQPLGDLLGLGLGRHQDMAGVHFLLRLQFADLLVVDLLGLGVGDRAVDLGIEERVAERAALMIFLPVWEIRGLIEIVGLAGACHQLVLDDELQEHLAAIRRRHAGEPWAHFRSGKIEIGLLDFDTIDARDDDIVGSGRQRDKAD